ncbi:hypothetical protein AM354_18415 [Serratia marcescens]|nr:hypothetical protein AM354_18415 [Serratia marcescens]
MWLMKTLLTSGCTNQRGAGQCLYKFKVVNVMPDSRAKNIFCVTTPLEHFTRYTSMSVKRSFDRRQPWISVSSILTTE